MTNLVHKHLLLNLRVSAPPRDAEEVEHFLAFLIKRIDMNIAKADSILKNPQGYLCPTLGNQGATGTGILETSHTALHTWTEDSPAKFDFDLYSCSDFDVDEILRLCQCFDIISGNYIVLDRGDTLTILATGNIGEDGVIIQPTKETV